MRGGVIEGLMEGEEGTGAVLVVEGMVGGEVVASEAGDGGDGRSKAHGRHN